MGAVQDAITKSRSRHNAAVDLGMRLKASGGLGGLLNMSPSDGLNQLSQFQNQGANRQRYGLFRGWVHSAVNALAMEAASQPVHLGRINKKDARKKPGSKKSAPLLKLPPSARVKSPAEQLDIITDHPLVYALENPNNIQYRWQFVYSYVANLCLTGWSFVVGGQSEDGNFEFYSIPTTWIEPNHAKGPFAEFNLRNPNNPGGYVNEKPLTRDQVAFAQLPNPADPMLALAPTQAQSAGIKIDDHIQSSQNVFFENGVFPSVLVTVGSNPHPDVPGGVRPRLTAPQRRQVYAAIRKVSGGVANYGNPAIVDGLIEKIERLSATQNEMGWEKSEQAVRTRILSAFAVHPFILGETMAGSYAQAYVVRDIFSRRVNLFLDLLSTMMTDLASRASGEDLKVWWEECKAVDPSMDQSLWNAARSRGDVTQNEFRGWMNLQPDEDSNEAQMDKSSIQPVMTVAAQTTAGAITPEQAQAILEGVGLSTELAKRIAGDGKPEEPAMGATSEEDAVLQAANSLDSAVKFLSEGPKEVVRSFLNGL